MITLQSVQSHTGLPTIINFLSFGHSGAQDLSARMPKCQKI